MYPVINVFNFHIPSYGLCMTLAILLCGILILMRARGIGLKFEDVVIFGAVILGSGLIGGALLYIVATYSVEELYVNIKNGDFSFITSGGLVFYGGLIGGMLGGIVCAKILKLKIDLVEACVVPYIPLGHAIGRIGCLLAGCCHGFAYKGLFAVTSAFGSEGVTYFPVQIVEALLNLMIMVILLLYAQRKRNKYSILSLYLMMYSVVRFILEFMRGDGIRGMFLVLSTSQWISLFIILCCILKSIYLKWRKYCVRTS